MGVGCVKPCNSACYGRDSERACEARGGVYVHRKEGGMEACEAKV